jgi:hypothetical protein
MKTLILRRVIPIVAIALALSTQGAAQGSTAHTLEGLVHHYTAALDAAGPWHISGEWDIKVKGDSGRADFAAALAMVRSDNPVRQPHTHHVTIDDGTFALTATGFSINGLATVTGNGNMSFTSLVDVLVTGGNALAHSNISVRFLGAPGIAHFGAEPLQGVVTRETP